MLLSSGSIAVRKANKASSSQLLLTLNNARLISKYIIKVACSKELLKYERNAIWSIFENNMHALYSQSSFGWDPTTKMEELFDPLSRFFLVYVDEELIAFAMFRFEFEDSTNILYCYELQISDMHQRIGIGKKLMQLLELVGGTWDMRKVMLTVLKANRNAVKFYAVAGFHIDDSSPVYCEEENPAEARRIDYHILSKTLS